MRQDERSKFVHEIRKLPIIISYVQFSKTMFSYLLISLGNNVLTSFELNILGKDKRITAGIPIKVRLNIHFHIGNEGVSRIGGGGD